MPSLFLAKQIILSFRLLTLYLYVSFILTGFATHTIYDYFEEAFPPHDGIIVLREKRARKAEIP